MKRRISPAPLKQWSEILTIISGKNQKNVKSDTGQYPIYGSGGIIGYATEYLCEAGTTIVGRKGTIDKPIFVNERFWNVDTAFGISPSDVLDAKYLYYFCRQFNFKKLDKSTTIPSLAKRDLLQIKMPVPPIMEQRRIVSRIEELFSKLDKGVETLQTIKQQLAVYQQVILKEEFAETTKYAPFGTIMQSRLGKMLDKKKNTGVLQRYLRNINVRWFSFDLSDIQQMKIEPSEHEKYSIEPGDLIICEGGEPGRCAVWESSETVYYQKALHRVRFCADKNPKYYMYYLWYAAQCGKLSSYFTGTGIKHLTGQSLERVPVPVIERENQDSVVERIETHLSVCKSIEMTICTALVQADAMRQSILKQAFEGKL